MRIYACIALLYLPSAALGGQVIPGQDFRTAICAQDPDSAICAVLVSDQNTVSDSQSELDNSDLLFRLTSTGAPATTTFGTGVDEKRRFCAAYSRHYRAYCTQSEIKDPSGLNQDQDKSQKFCGTYSGSCNGDYEIQIQEYCEKYQNHYQHFCKNIFDHGPKAAKFCPLYATKCNSRFDVPLFEPGVLFGKKEDTPKTTTPAGTSTLDWFYQPTTTCGLDCADPADFTEEEIEQMCEENRDQGERYCSGPIGQSPSYKKKCDYYKEYCIKDDKVDPDDPWAAALSAVKEAGE